MKVIQAVCALSLCIALLGSCASTPRARLSPRSTRWRPLRQARIIFGIWLTRPANTYKGARHAIVQQGRPFIYLAANPGAAGEGAYGAGILNGWTQSGARPEFTTVSGVSTGALIAPSPFSGPTMTRGSSKYIRAARRKT